MQVNYEAGSARTPIRTLERFILAYKSNNIPKPVELRVVWLAIIFRGDVARGYDDKNTNVNRFVSPLRRLCIHLTSHNKTRTIEEMNCGQNLAHTSALIYSLVLAFSLLSFR